MSPSGWPKILRVLKTGCGCGGFRFHGLILTAFQVWSQIWDHSPHHFVVFSHNFVSFGQKIKVDIDLETGESRAHA